jgi:sec-independent protein translocase protein TatC
MPLMQHLIELRDRLKVALIGVVVGMAVGLLIVWPDGPINFVDTIITAFVPINESYPPVQAVGTAEAFISYMTVALALGIVFSMPLLVYQLLLFIIPALHKPERRIVYVALPFVTAFFAAGLAFGWFITVPTAINFLIGFSGSSLIAVQPALSDFLRMVTLLLVINGVVFELPIIIFLLAYLGITDAHQLRSYRRYALVIVVIVAAIITPTGDPINLMLLAVPMYFLYELGVILARFAPKRQ